MQEATAFESEFREMRLTFIVRVSVPANSSLSLNQFDGMREAVQVAISQCARDNNMAVGSILSLSEKLN